MSNTVFPNALHVGSTEGFDRVEVVRLLELLLDEPWHKRCEIIPDYMPPFPRPDTQPEVCIRYNDGTEYPPFLRYSKGPKQGFFWDIYGDHFHDVPLAIVALSQAPAPRSVGPITFRIPLGERSNISGVGA